MDPTYAGGIDGLSNLDQLLLVGGGIFAPNENLNGKPSTF